MLCLFFCFLLKREDGFFASIASVICMQQTPDESFNIGKHRFLGTLTGGILGYFSFVFLQNFGIYSNIINIIFTPLIILFMIYFLNIVNKKSSSQIGCVVLLSLLANKDRNISGAHFYVINRVLDTCMGIVIAVLVNKLIFPLKSNNNQQTSENLDNLNCQKENKQLDTEENNLNIEENIEEEKKNNQKIVEESIEEEKKNNQEIVEESNENKIEENEE